MRFTVHDSPDYYQMKVSVFNDDKKTELIGETWVPLDQIVVPGGGQNDLWHHLSCKGRFAGEIRIELTYYDTRPKEEKMEGKHREITVHQSHEQVKEGIVGPRQPKTVKRRPLPADPTQPATPPTDILEHSQPSPMAYTPPSSNHHTPNPQIQYASQSMELRSPPSAPPEAGHQLLADENGFPPIFYDSHGQESYEEHMRKSSFGGGSGLPYQYHESNRSSDSDTSKMTFTRNDTSTWQKGPSHGQVNGHRLPLERNSYLAEESLPNNPHTQQCDDGDTQTAGLAQRHHDSFGMQLSRTPPSLPQQRSMPEAHSDPRMQDISPQNQRNSFSSVQRHETPIRQPINSNGDSWPSPTPDEDGPPPPPPIHRNSGQRAMQQRSERDHGERYSSATAPVPLHIRSHRASASGSPLAHFQSTVSNDEYFSSLPSNPQSPSHPGAAVSSYHHQPDRKQSQITSAQVPAAGFAHVIPLSLMPGYDPNLPEEASASLLDERHSMTRRSITAEPLSTQLSHPTQQPYYESMRHNQSLPRRTSQLEFQTYRDDYSPQQQSLPSRSSQSQSHPSPRTDHIKSVHPQDMARERISHSSSAPILESSSVKPVPRTPMRKSISPALERPPGERRTSAIPFSPDSYESLNPSLSAASSINLAGPQYKTPEQARDAFHEREREAQLNTGPIIDSDGKVIDPSDHLPTDTWAPEPEPKPSRKGPEITLRFRHSPQGAQPMPLSTRRSPLDRQARPHATPAPIYAHSPQSTSPGGFASRPPFQSRVHGSPSQPNSSPTVPTVHSYGTRSSMPRASASDYPLPSIETHGYGQTHSPYHGGSPSYAIPPPVPGKIPIAPAASDPGMSALSEEMMRIDIGVGGGPARSRRSRFGA